MKSEHSSKRDDLRFSSHVPQAESTYVPSSRGSCEGSPTEVLLFPLKRSGLLWRADSSELRGGASSALSPFSPTKEGRGYASREGGVRVRSNFPATPPLPKAKETRE